MWREAAVERFAAAAGAYLETPRDGAGSTPRIETQSHPGDEMVRMTAALDRLAQRIETAEERSTSAIGGVELSMPVVHPAELWQQSGRYQAIGPELTRFHDRRDRDMVLAMTHEEVVATLAAGEMSVLDCVLYLADGLEPGRDYPERAALAEMAGRHLPGAMRATIESSLRYLSSKHLPLAPQTADAMQRFGAQPMTEATTGGHS